MLTEHAPLKLSRRVEALEGSSTLAVAARIRELKQRGIDVIGFGAGEPDFDTPEHIKEAAIAALRAGRTRYAPTAGEPEAREAVAEKLRRENGIDCRAEHVVITAGAKHALYEAIQCLIDPGRGQQVILPTPAWVSFAPMIELAGGEVVEVPGAVDNDFKITPEQLAAAITPRTALLVLNSPSNPCGTMYTPAEIRALADVLLEHPQVAVISDEIYERLVYGEADHLSPASIEGLAERVVTVNGLSKSYAMTGWRVGFLCAPGGDGALARGAERLQSQMTSCIPSFIYPAIVRALEHGADDVERMRRAFAERARLIHGLVSRWPLVRCPRPTGAFYVFPDIGAHFGRTTARGTRIDSTTSFCRALLEEANVAVVPGDDFGTCARTHVRLSFALADKQIEEGCRRIEGWLKSLK